MSRYVMLEPERPLQVGSKPLGQGGQGEVFSAEAEGKTWALKLYYKGQDTPAQQKIIARLVAKGSPSPHFLWPERLALDTQEKRFGYLMPLREPRFKPTEDLMARRVKTHFRALLTASLQLSEAFLKLHAKGLSYRDISFGNVFIDPVVGDVRICDNDNVAVTGEAPAGVLGTPRFMAPEVVRGEAPPSDDTDRFSLAVLLFYLLYMGHPLEGAREAAIKCMDLPAMNRLYGETPLYIFDPADLSNRPVAGVHDNPLIYDAIYPTSIRQAFERAFTVGLRKPRDRMRESEWRKLFAQARDVLRNCPHCKQPNFYDAAQPGKTCWHCRTPLPSPRLLSLPAGQLVLRPGMQLYEHHIQDIAYQFDTVLAEVTEKPGQPDVLGLKNLTTEKWTFQRPDGALVEVPPGRHAPLVSGNVLHLAGVEGKVL